MTITVVQPSEEIVEVLTVAEEPRAIHKVIGLLTGSKAQDPGMTHRFNGRHSFSNLVIHDPEGEVELGKTIDFLEDPEHQRVYKGILPISRDLEEDLVECTVSVFTVI